MGASARHHAASRAALLGYLVRMEFERRFAGSVGGRIWVFAGPLLSIAIIWAALDLGLGLRASLGVGYGLALAVGLCCWLYFAEAVGGALNAIVGQPHLVKKVVFPVLLLPLTQALTAFAVHLVILGVIIAGVMLQGVSMSWAVLMLPFWSACLLAVTVSAALLVAGLNVLARDTGAIVPNLISLFFWLTPVVWPADRLSAEQKLLVYLNPPAVIIEGYRAALLGSPPPLSLTGVVTFAAAVAAILALSLMAFRRMRSQFADVL